MHNIVELRKDDIRKLPNFFSDRRFDCYNSFETNLPGIAILINGWGNTETIIFHLLNAKGHLVLVIIFSLYEISETIYIGKDKDKDRAISLIKRKILEKFSTFGVSYSKKRKLAKSITALLKEKIK